MSVSHGERMRRVALVVAATAFAAQAVALAAWRVVGGGVGLPVVAVFDDRTVELAQLDLGWALCALLAGGAVCLAGAARTVDTRRAAAWLLAGWSQGAGIIVVLVARLNTVADASTLIALFALAAGSVCVQLSDRDRRERTWCRPGAWAAAIGLVPWGIIAFGQIGSSLVGGGPSAGIRVVTLVALAATAFAWWIRWRRDVPTATDIAAVTVGLSAVAWGIAAVA